jgi:thioesterase domain-containing protein
LIPIYITGHSLGGALAQIASAVLGDDQVAACYHLDRR